MNKKELFFLLLSSFAFAVLFQYFFASRQGSAPVSPSTGQHVSAPQPQQVEEAYKLLNKEIDFVDAPSAQPVQISEIETPYAHLAFSSAGGCLRSMVYKRTTNGKPLLLTIINPPTDVEREKACFLVALEEKTPYFYELINRTEDEQSVQLTYKASVDKTIIEKRFTVFKAICKIDLDLTIKPADGQTVQPRLFFTGPLLVGGTKAEHTAGIVEEKKSITKYGFTRNLYELEHDYWGKPTLFGAEDRYFINAMVRDENDFAQRGYFKLMGEQLFPILEGPAITKEASWKCSFYLGPKEQSSIAAVDSRLEEVLDYGWLAFLAKPMLQLMKWLNSYVHNFGLVILLVTLLMRLLLLPLTLHGAKNAEKFKEVQKKVQYLKQRYKDDQEAYQREQAEIYKKYGLDGLSGLGSGCLPLVLQLPIFFAINRVLSSSIELYQAPFLWMPDLSAKDPYYILPILVAISMLLTTLQSADTQQRISGVIMAVLFGAFSLGFSAGLALYIFASTALGVVQIYGQKVLRL